MNTHSRHPALLSWNISAFQFDVELIKRRIRKAGCDTVAVKPLKDGTGLQFVVLGGGIVTIYRTGKVRVQGKVSPESEKRLLRHLQPREG